MGSFQGRGTALWMMVVMVSLSCKGVVATTYKVGDGKWTITSYDSWLSGKTFKVGDTLEFVYSGSVHNVVEVNEAEYGTCSGGSNPVFTDGDTKYTLSTAGTKYYICSVPTHCEGGMKIAVTVEASSPTPTTPSSPTPSGSSPTPSTTPSTTPSSPSTTPSTTPPSNSSPLSVAPPFFTLLLTLGLSILFFKS